MVDFSPPDSGISPAGFGEGPGPLRKVTGMIFPKKSRVPIWILQVLNRSDVMAQEARSRESEAEWAPQNNTLMRDLSENRVPLDVLINYHIYILSSSLKLQLFRYSMVYPLQLARPET